MKLKCLSYSLVLIGRFVIYAFGKWELGYSKQTYFILLGGRKIPDHSEQADQIRVQISHRMRLLFSRWPVPHHRIGRRLPRSLEFHDRKDQEGSEVPGAGQLHDDGGGGLVSGLFQRQRDVGVWVWGRSDSGLEDCHRSVSQKVREGAH